LSIATALLMCACGAGVDRATEPTPEPPATMYRMEIVSGQDQRDETGALLLSPLTVRVTDLSTGVGVPSMVVLFTPSAGSGSLSADSAITDVAGLASVRWTLGPGDGAASHVTAKLRRAPEVSRTFDAIAVTERIRAIALASGPLHACALLVSKRVACWGQNGNGELGDGTTTIRSYAVLVTGAPDFEQITVGGYHACGLTASGEAWCWGWNVAGQVGDGSTTSRSTPTRAAASGLQFAQLVAGAMYTCGLTTAGDVYCWGQLEGPFAITPQNFSQGTRFRTLERAGMHPCGVGVDGRSRCLELTMTTDGVNGGPGEAWRPQDAPLPGLTGFVGQTVNACALDADGVAYCWGDNQWGQLGIGSAAPVTDVQQVTGGYSFRRLYDGFENICGVTTAGATYCWGHNRYGQIGAPPARPEAVLTPAPLDFVGTPSFTTLAGGTFHFCGLATDTTVYCWGGNPLGALGDGSEVSPNTSRATPGPVLRR
jgi:alpha-tubulin suppressor-like RCC1 family protein